VVGNDVTPTSLNEGRGEVVVPALAVVWCPALPASTGPIMASHPPQAVGDDVAAVVPKSINGWRSEVVMRCSYVVVSHQPEAPSGG